MIRRPPRSTLFPTRRSSDLRTRRAADGGLPRRVLPGDVGEFLVLPRLRRADPGIHAAQRLDRKSTRLNSSHSQISYAVFCLKKKKNHSLTFPSYYDLHP